jgi:hypothetical protein
MYGSRLGISIDNYILYWYVVDYVLFTLFPYLICLVYIQISLYQNFIKYHLTVIPEIFVAVIIDVSIITVEKRLCIIWNVNVVIFYRMGVEIIIYAAPGKKTV